MDSKTYMWPQADNPTPMVGTKVLFGSETTNEPVYEEGYFLMRPLYGTAGQWVHANNLSEYVGGRGT